jgi:hypothetical protein
MPPKKAPATKPAAAVAKKPTPLSTSTKPTPNAEWFGLNISYTTAISGVYKDSRIVYVVFFVSGVSKQAEHPIIQITGPQTVCAVWNFDKRLLGRNLPLAISKALNFSTESARYDA